MNKIYMKNFTAFLAATASLVSIEAKSTLNSIVTKTDIMLNKNIASNDDAIQQTITARKKVLDMANKYLTPLQDPSVTAKEKKRSFKHAFLEYFALDKIARNSLPRTTVQMNDEQFNRYKKLLPDLLANLYIYQFIRLKNMSICIGQADIKSSNRLNILMVQSTISYDAESSNTNDDGKIEIVWIFSPVSESDKNASMCILDLQIEKSFYVNQLLKAEIKNLLDISGSKKIQSNNEYDYDKFLDLLEDKYSDKLK